MDRRLDDPLPMKQPPQAGIPDGINRMIEPVHRNIHRLPRCILLPFVVFQLPYQVDRPLCNINQVALQNVDPGQD